VLAGEPPNIAHVHETRPRGYQGSVAGAVGARPHEQALDDWLGDISDEDWSEDATERAKRRHATPADQERPVPERDLWRDPTADRPLPARSVAAAKAHRAVIERRRLVAGLVVVVVLGLAVVIPVLLLRGGGQAPVARGPAPTTTTPAPSETNRSTAPTARSTNPSTTTPSTTPSTPGASTFTLPEGTKLQLGEGDPAVIEELQRALSSAGYVPGPADGTFGRRTEAAVIAFQQANGLSADGVVGPETASALNSAVAGG
jgi:Putative peptidoglycan binding domain